MSWIDRIENVVFTITTGEGSRFAPLWKSGETSKEFNQTAFDFIDKDGSFIDRKKVKARKFPLTFWFQGDDNIEQADAFDKAAVDNRAWLVTHPYYGDITCQPLSLTRSDPFYNVTEITCEVWETITLNLPVARVALPELTAARFTSFSNAASIDYASKTLPKPVDVSKATESTQKLSAIITPILDGTTYAEYQAKKNTMISAVDNLIAAPITAVQTIHEVEKAPAEFSLAMKTRQQTLLSIYKSMRIDYIDFSSPLIFTI